MFLTREEFALLMDITVEWTYKAKDFPKPCKKQSRQGTHKPLWSIEVAQEYARTKQRLNYNQVKRLNNSGMTRKDMAEALKTTTKKIDCFCRYHKIISLATIKDIKARKTYNLKVQNELLPRPPIEHPFNLYLHRHVKTTPTAIR